ncbi:2Fe-2S iron-sulfur cluster-binding protein [Sphingobium indicum]|uniref:2Fe-2S iron-sulfur cluster-binding protein n=1 Tax=Sphingobium indicum TaxID=332055 RepID=UPI00055D569E|nr:2Fe-2S iron-sulfur cluster-binding protein [Sphingobium indicum]
MPDRENIRVLFTLHQGETIEVSALPGQSIRQVALDNDVLGIVGECGGSGACGTCHAYVGGQWTERLSPPSEDEQEMLEYVLEPKPNSRLTCQIIVEEAIDGLEIIVPDHQF